MLGFEFDVNCRFKTFEIGGLRMVEFKLNDF